jgi:hypothetical protein
MDQDKHFGSLVCVKLLEMRLALMLKWVWRIHQHEDHDKLPFHFCLLTAKYPHIHSVLNSASQGGSHPMN